VRGCPSQVKVGTVAGEGENPLAVLTIKGAGLRLLCLSGCVGSNPTPRI